MSFERSSSSQKVCITLNGLSLWALTAGRNRSKVVRLDKNYGYHQVTDPYPPGGQPPQIMFPVVAELAGRDGLPVVLACRVLGVDLRVLWLVQAWLFGADGLRRRAHGHDHRDPHGPAPHLRRTAGARGTAPRARHPRRPQTYCPADAFGRARRCVPSPKACTKRDPGADPHLDLVNRKFTVDGPERLWCMDVTQHRAGVRAGCTARSWWMRSPAASWAGRSPTICAPNWSVMPSTWPGGGASRRRGDGSAQRSRVAGQYTSWAFGQRLRQAGLLG